MNLQIFQVGDGDKRFGVDVLDFIILQISVIQQTPISST